jgi:hypothetical protein
MAVERVEHRVQLIICAGLDMDLGHTDFEADAAPKQLGDRPHEHRRCDRQAGKIVNFDAITGLEADPFAFEQLAELAERLSSREDLNVIGVQARLLALNRRRTRCLREESDAFTQSSALYAKRIILRPQRRLAPPPPKKGFF